MSQPAKSFDALTDFILNQAEIIWDKLSAIYNCGNLPKINVVCEANNCAGFAYYNLSKGVEFNLIYFAEMSEADKIETIAHELSHVVCFKLFPAAKQAHGPEFRSIMSSIGMKGDTYHYTHISDKKAAVRAITATIISDDDF